MTWAQGTPAKLRVLKSHASGFPLYEVWVLQAPLPIDWKVSTFLTVRLERNFLNLLQGWKQLVPKAACVDPTFTGIWRALSAEIRLTRATFSECLVLRVPLNNCSSASEQSSRYAGNLVTQRCHVIHDRRNGTAPTLFDNDEILLQLRPAMSLRTVAGSRGTPKVFYGYGEMFVAQLTQLWFSALAERLDLWIVLRQAFLKPWVGNG